MTVALARWLLRRRKLQLERKTSGRFDHRLSLELEKVIAALAALEDTPEPQVWVL